MTLSSPDAPAREWLPVDLTDADTRDRQAEAATPAVAVAPFAPNASVPARPNALFELAAATDVPEALLGPARVAAESAGYAAGWKQGTAAAAAVAAQAAEANRLELLAIREQTTARVNQALTAVQGAARELTAREAALGHDLEQLVLDTAFHIAEAVVGAHLADDEKRGAEALRRVLDLAPADNGVTVRLSRADHEIVTAGASVPATVHLVADATLQPGDARASVGATTVDARLSAALQRVRRVLDEGRA